MIPGRGKSLKLVSRDMNGLPKVVNRQTSVDVAVNATYVVNTPKA